MLQIANYTYSCKQQAKRKSAVCGTARVPAPELFSNSNRLATGRHDLNIWPFTVWFPSSRISDYRPSATHRIALHRNSAGTAPAFAEECNTYDSNCLGNVGGMPLAAAGSCVTDFFATFSLNGKRLRCGALRQAYVTE